MILRPFFTVRAVDLRYTPPGQTAWAAGAPAETSHPGPGRRFMSLPTPLVLLLSKRKLLRLLAAGALFFGLRWAIASSTSELVPAQITASAVFGRDARYAPG